LNYSALLRYKLFYGGTDLSLPVPNSRYGQAKICPTK
jgi:hypothetical protein